jgi:hypothetical protein
VTSGLLFIDFPGSMQTPVDPVQVEVTGLWNQESKYTIREPVSSRELVALAKVLFAREHPDLSEGEYRVVAGNARVLTPDEARAYQFGVDDDGS